MRRCKRKRQRKINRFLKRIRKIRDEEETSREPLLEVLYRRKQQEEEMWNEFEEYMASMGDREETNDYVEHENLENDTKQCDTGGESGVTLLKYHQRQKNWVGLKEKAT